MNITQRQSPNRAIGRQNNVPDIIALHTTGASFTSAINTIMNPANQVSYHFVISRDGDIVQAVDIENTAWANGTNNTAGDNRNNQHSTIPIVRERRINANLYSISIGFGDMPTGIPSPKQFYAAVDLIRHIVDEVRRIYGHTIPFSRTNIVGHDEITPRTRPNCPGKAFPWDELLSYLNNPRQAPSYVQPQEKPPAPPPRTVSIDILGEVQEIGGLIENGTTFVRLTDVAAALGFVATWDRERRIPIISTAKEAEARPLISDTLEEEITTAAEDIDLLKAITHWEARGEDEKGQILVVNVIMNRLKSPNFPNTVREVIFASGAFTPTQREDFDLAIPNARTIAAVNKALGGTDYSQGATYFHALRGITPEVWHERAVASGQLVRLFDHGGHRFYREA